jgi:Holliday junction resolvase RusA-like endonuclease
MNDWVKIVVDGAPVPKGRPRLGKGRVYTPKRTKAQEEKIKLFALLEMRVKRLLKPFEGRICLDVEIVQKSRRGDIDNHVKLVSDALNGIVYVDDEQIDEIHVWRTICDDGEKTIITVSEATDAGGSGEGYGSY